MQSEKNMIQQSVPSAYSVLKNETGYSKLSGIHLINLVSFLHPQYIFAVLPLINKQSEGLLKIAGIWHTKYWELLYEAPFDIKKSQQDYLDRKINRQVFLLYAAIKTGATNFLLKECRSWNLKIVLSILPLSRNKNFILLDLMHQSQLSIAIPYLIRSRKKSQNLVQNTKNKLSELKDDGFDFLRLLAYELSKIDCLTKEKNHNKFYLKSRKFLKILKTLKSILSQDLNNYSQVFSAEKLSYLKLFFKILFWDKSDTDNIEYTEENFRKQVFGTFKSFTLNSYYENFIFNQSTNYLAPFFDFYQPAEMNELVLGVIIGNLHFLKARAELIRAFFSLSHPTCRIIDKLFTNLPSILFKEATRKGHVAVVQFLSEQEIKAQLEPEMIAANHHSAINQSIRSANYNLMILNIAHGGVSTLERSQAELIYSTNVIGRINKIDFLALIILTQANIPIDSRIETYFTLLEILANNTYSYLNVTVKGFDKKNKYLASLFNFFEAIRFLIILGASTKEFKEYKSKAVINFILKFSQQESFDIPLEQENSISSLYLESKEYISNLSKVCFLQNLPEKDSSAPELKCLSL